MRAEQSKERRYKKAKRFIEWFKRKWWLICMLLTLFNFLNFIFVRINSKYFKLPLVSDICLFIGYVMLFSAEFAVPAILYAFKIVDDYEGNN